MSVATEPKSSWKERKRQLKQSRKEQKWAQKQARKESKLSRKFARLEQRTVVSNKAIVQRDEAVQMLEEILAGLKSGGITLADGERKVSISPPESLRISVRGRQTHKSEGIRIALRWPRTAAEGPADVNVPAE